MIEKSVYHYKMSRRKRSRLYINMSVACLLYIAGLFIYEGYSGEVVPSDFKYIWIGAFSFITALLSWATVWHLLNPGVYEANITFERFSVIYPEYPRWSFDISVSDILRFEYRQSRSHAGKSAASPGILMKNGDFHYVSMNYGNSINKMHKAILKVRPDIKFIKRVRA